MSVSLIWLEGLRVELVALGVHFDNCGSPCAPIPGLLVSLVICVELGQEGLIVTLVLDGQKSSLEVLGWGQILVAVFLAWWISPSSSS